MTKLITLTESERREANAMYMDPDAWPMAEASANRQWRNEIFNMARAIEIARANPDDPDCKRLLDALKTC